MFADSVTKNSLELAARLLLRNLDSILTQCMIQQLFGYNAPVWQTNHGPTSPFQFDDQKNH